MMERPISHATFFSLSSRSCLTALAFGLALPSAAVAQTVGAPTREELQRPEIEAELRGQESPVTVDGDIERAPCALAGPQFADLKFTLSQAQFDGLRALDPSLLDSAWRQYVGQEISVATICDIRDRAATILRSEGYLAAVQVPVQTIDEGRVKFDVLLARIAEVQVRGDAGGSESLLRGYMSKLEGQDVFNSDDAERYLLLARDIPGLNVRMTLQPAPGGQPGDVVGVIDVAHQKAIVDVNVQNYGSRQIGRFGGLARARFNGLTGLGDETMLSVYSAEDFDEQLVFSGYHEFRAGTEGLTLGLSGTVAFTQPDVPGPNVFETTTFVGSAYARYPLIRSQAQNLTVTGGADFINQSVEFTGTDFTRDRLRVAFARVDLNGSDKDSISGRGGYSAAEPRLSYNASLEARQGIDIFGASEKCGAGFVNCTGAGVVPPSRLTANPHAFVVRGLAGVTYRPTPIFGLSARARFQYSSSPLLGYEQFSGGNFTVGRGYDPGAIIGDKGYGFQLEAFVGSAIPENPKGTAVQPFVFFDLAQVELNSTPKNSDRLHSAGGGVRFTLGRQAALDFTLAVPLERTNFATSKGAARALLSLTVQLEPWFK